jgi:hypothetical protein
VPENIDLIGAEGVQIYPATTNDSILTCDWAFIRSGRCPWILCRTGVAFAATS